MFIGNAVDSYTADPAGRVRITNVTAPYVSGATFTFRLYLDGNGNALAIGVDQYESSGGLSILQNALGSDYEGNFALSTQGILKDSGLWERPMKMGRALGIGVPPCCHSSLLH